MLLNQGIPIPSFGFHMPLLTASYVMCRRKIIGAEMIRADESRREKELGKLMEDMNVSDPSGADDPQQRPRRLGGL